MDGKCEEGTFLLPMKRTAKTSLKLVSISASQRGSKSALPRCDSEEPQTEENSEQVQEIAPLHKLVTHSTGF